MPATNEATSKRITALRQTKIRASADIHSFIRFGFGVGISLGYRTFMFEDKVYFRRDSIIEALNRLEAGAF